MRLVLRCLFSIALISSLLMAAVTPASANSKYAAYVVHAHSGDVLFDRYSNQRRYPASLTKMMTLYLLFDEIEAGRLSMDSKLNVSVRAAGQPPSKLGVKKGRTIDVETAINALVVKSANDVAVVVAESISGSEWKFATKMTQKARSLGMRRTTFRNASGLPNRKQVTTARDMATLARRLMQDHPSYWHHFSTKSFAWNGRTYRTHNSLVRSFDGADGLKTGYTRRSGYNLATTAKRDGHHLIGIVLGGRSGRTRDAHMRKILVEGFSSIKKRPTRIAALHRTKPAPRMKPNLVAQLALEASAPTVASNDALKNEIFVATSDFGVPTAENSTDPIGALITAAQYAGSAGTPSDLNQAEQAKLAALMPDEDGFVGEGDAEDPLAWSVQIGAYSTKLLAQKELEAAAIASDLTDRLRAVQPMAGPDDSLLYRARFIALSESEATETCATLSKNQINCFAVSDFNPTPVKAGLDTE